MNANIQEIKAHLGLAPRTAQDLAESTGDEVKRRVEAIKDRLKTATVTK